MVTLDEFQLLELGNSFMFWTVCNVRALASFKNYILLGKLHGRVKKMKKI